MPSSSNLREPTITKETAIIVLFLDIDGVLNCESTTERVDQGIFKGMIGLDSVLVKRLKDWLADHPDVQVVLSSTWRQDARLLELIKEAGIPFIGMTRTLRNRATEIDDWVAAHKVTSYAILDDIAQFNAGQRKRFVKTSYDHGLREKDLRAIEAILY